MMNQTSESLMAEIVDYELMRLRAVDSAELYAISSETETRFLMVVRSAEAKKAVEAQVGSMIFRLKKWPHPGREYSVNVTTDSSVDQAYQEVKRWSSFDPKRRNQAIRWGWINSPIGYVWIPLFVLLPIVLAMHYFIQ